MLQVKGLTEFNKALKAMGSDLPKALRIALNSAADVIVADAKPRVASRTGRARGTVKAQSTRTSARVSAGGRRAPYYPWLDFGGTIPVSNVSRPFLKNGRYIYNAYFKRRDEFGDVLEHELLELARRSGIEVTRG